MLNLNAKLRELEDAGRKINIGVVGTGQMGRSMTCQMLYMKGLKPAIISNRDIEKAKNVYMMAGVSPDDIAAADTSSKAQEFIDKGKFVVTDDYNIVAEIQSVDVIVDATGAPEVGAQLGLNSIFNGKHIVMLNVEADATIGPILRKMADAAGVVYTVSAGDEPGAIKELYDFADGVGFKVLVAGKGKNNPLNIHANPDTVMEKAKAKNMNAMKLASFVDGTNTMIEMTAVSNALGFVPSRRGLIGPRATVEDLPKLLSLKEQGGILECYQVVEYVNGIAPGVFVIVTTDLPVLKDEMEYLSMGQGPNYILYRPYHLASIETPLSAARAYIYNEPTMAPKGLFSDTITVAKKNLRVGEHLDGIGGYKVYGVIDTYENARKENALPIGLINEKTVLKKDVKKGEIVTYDMVALDESSIALQLRRMQDRLPASFLL